ncbi:MAG: hypothetical protein JSS63_15095 [Bacteroidetes bacterium]|nr:hypothetical protein [Bacteroidota bacterium]
MKFFLAAIIIFLAVIISPFKSFAQPGHSYDNSSIARLMTFRILFKENLDAESKLLKRNKVKKIYLKNSKDDFWSERIRFIDVNGLINMEYSFDTMQSPVSAVRIVYDSINMPSIIYQTDESGLTYISHFYYKNGKISSIIYSGDSIDYYLSAPVYSDNPGEPMLTKIKMQRYDDDYYYINFKYSESGKLIRVYEEGSPDLYKILNEPDKITLTTVENDKIVLEFKNNIAQKMSLDFDGGKGYISYENKFSASGLRESVTVSYKDIDGKMRNYTQYYQYEFYK